MTVTQIYSGTIGSLNTLPKTMRVSAENNSEDTFDSLDRYEFEITTLNKIFEASIK